MHLNTRGFGVRKAARDGGGRAGAHLAIRIPTIFEVAETCFYKNVLYPPVDRFFFIILLNYRGEQNPIYGKQYKAKEIQETTQSKRNPGIGFTLRIEIDPAIFFYFFLYWVLYLKTSRYGLFALKFRVPEIKMRGPLEFRLW